MQVQKESKHAHRPFPTHFFGHLPAPLERTDRLSRALGGPEIWSTRDDCTELFTGGNKTRKLEFLMTEAVAQNADMVITQGATQSNHARQTAALFGYDSAISAASASGAA